MDAGATVRFTAVPAVQGEALVAGSPVSSRNEIARAVTYEQSTSERTFVEGWSEEVVLRLFRKLPDLRRCLNDDVPERVFNIFYEVSVTPPREGKVELGRE